MSGPIVRKYGFPNFENIFGKRDLEHGVDEESTPPSEAPADDKTQSPKATDPKKKKS